MCDVYKWLRGCLRKKVFKSLAGAESYLPHYEGKFKQKFRVYKCPDCLNWHYTRIKRGCN